MTIMLELIIFVATLIILIIVLRKLPLEKEVVEKIAYEARQSGDNTDINPDTDLLAKADNLAQSGDYSRAEKIYLRLVSTDPQNASLYNKLALVYLGKKDFRDAAKSLDQALTLEPDNDAFYNNLGLLLYQQGNYDEAIESYEKSIEINNKVASRFMNLGLAYFMSKKYRKASEAYEKALILEPTNEEFKRLLKEAEEKLK